MSKAPVCVYIAIADRATFASLPSLAGGDADADCGVADGRRWGKNPFSREDVDFIAAAFEFVER